LQVPSGVAAWLYVTASPARLVPFGFSSVVSGDWGQRALAV